MLLLSAILISLASSALARQCSCGATWAGGSVNVRSCASTSCSIVGSINPGYCYNYHSTSGTWFEITYGISKAWVHSDYVSGPQQCGAGVGGLCTANLCSTYSSNQRRGCDAQGCGNYGASRGSRAHSGWDIKCTMGALVYAPFSGTLVREAKPYGSGSCCDTGFEIQGTGSWSGHKVLVFYAKPRSNLIGSSVSAGQVIADHQGLHCGCYSTSMTDHIHYQVDYYGTRIDPASWIFCN